jgi:hypothetical protein
MSEQKTLGEVLRENAMKRPAAHSGHWIQWRLVAGGIEPLPPVAVDCLGSDPECGKPCHNRPVWVIEDFDGYHPTCLEHSGKVLNALLQGNNAETAMYFHPYKGE